MNDNTAEYDSENPQSDYLRLAKICIERLQLSKTDISLTELQITAPQFSDENISKWLMFDESLLYPAIGLLLNHSPYKRTTTPDGGAEITEIPMINTFGLISKEEEEIIRSHALNLGEPKQEYLDLLKVAKDNAIKPSNNIAIKILSAIEESNSQVRIDRNKIKSIKYYAGPSRENSNVNSYYVTIYLDNETSPRLYELRDNEKNETITQEIIGNRHLLKLGVIEKIAEVQALLLFDLNMSITEFLGEKRGEIEKKSLEQYNSDSIMNFFNLLYAASQQELEIHQDQIGNTLTFVALPEDNGVARLKCSFDSIVRFSDENEEEMPKLVTYQVIISKIGNRLVLSLPEGEKFNPFGKRVYPQFQPLISFFSGINETINLLDFKSSHYGDTGKTLTQMINDINSVSIKNGLRHTYTLFQKGDSTTLDFPHGTNGDPKLN